MTKLTITAKGQVTLRKDVLAHLGVGPGDKVEVALLPSGRMEVRAARTGRISDAFGLLKRPGQPVLSIDEINDAIASRGLENHEDRRGHKHPGSRRNRR